MIDLQTSPTKKTTNMSSLLPQQLARIFTGKLTKASGLMFVATIGGGLLGYVFQILMGRMLSVADYGLFIAMMALLVVVAVPLSTLTMLVSRRASEYRAKQQPEKTAAMFWWVNGRVLSSALIVLLLTLPFSSFLRDYAHLETLTSIWIFLLVAVAMLFGPVNIAFLQAQQNFRWIAFASVGLHGFKILFCVVLVFAGLKLFGALMGVLMASMAIWLMTFLPLRSVVARPINETRPERYFSIKNAAPVLVANLAFAVMTQLDLLLVNHYFDAQHAGVYAAAAILGKAVMYLPGAIIIAMFPMVAENESNSRSSAHLFINAIVLTVGFSGLGALIYFLFSEEIITLLYGQKYPGAAELLKYYGFAMLPMSIIMVAEHFLIAKGRVIFAYVMMLGIPFVLYAAHNYNERLIDMVYILIAGGCGVALVGFGVIGAQNWRGWRLGNSDQ